WLFQKKPENIRGVNVNVDRQEQICGMITTWGTENGIVYTAINTEMREQFPGHYNQDMGRFEYCWRSKKPGNRDYEDGEVAALLRAILTYKNLKKPIDLWDIFDFLELVGRFRERDKLRDLFKDEFDAVLRRWSVRDVDYDHPIQ